MIFALLSAGVIYYLMAGEVSEEVSTERSCYIGVFCTNDLSNMQLIDDFESAIGKKVAMVMWYEGWGASFPQAKVEKVHEHGAIPHITWEPWTPLSGIIAGQQDSYIRGWAQAAKAWGKPVFIRWGHEFNIQHYPWSLAKNDWNAQLYINAYRHVHDVFTQEGADNVKWIWSFDVWGDPAGENNDYKRAYPGDAYVDWIGIDGYNWGANGTKSFGFKVLFADAVRVSSTEWKNKPIMLAEFACAEEGVNKAAWITYIPDALKEEAFKNVRAIVWFNIDKRQVGERDWRINSSQASLIAFQEIVQDEYFLSSAEGLWEAKYLGIPQIEERETIIIKAPATITIDGELDEWTGAQPMTMDGREFVQEGIEEYWDGPSDVSGSVYAMWDEQNLYVAARIKDDLPLINIRTDNDIWDGDAIEICLSTDPSADPNRSTFAGSDYQLGFSTGSDGAPPAQLWVWQYQKGEVDFAPTGGEIKVVKTQDGYNLEARVPWTNFGNFLPSSGMIIDFDSAIDDADVEWARTVQLVWCGDVFFFENPSLWGEATFTE